MVIQEDDFIATSCGENSNFWDLELLRTIKPKGGEERQEFKDAGFGLTFSSLIKRIINYRIEKKQDVLSLKEYLSSFKEQLDSIKSLFAEF